MQIREIATKFLTELTKAEPPPQSVLSRLGSWVFGGMYTPITKARMSDPDEKTVNFLKFLQDEDILAWGKPEIIDPRDLWTFQWKLSRRKLNRYLKNSETKSQENPYELPDTIPVVASYNGYKVILDGNHRCSAALLRGEQIKVWLVDCDSIERANNGNA